MKNWIRKMLHKIGIHTYEKKHSVVFLTGWEREQAIKFKWPTDWEDVRVTCKYCKKGTIHRRILTRGASPSKD